MKCRLFSCQRNLSDTSIQWHYFNLEMGCTWALVKGETRETEREGGRYWTWSIREKENGEKGEREEEITTDLGSIWGLTNVAACCACWSIITGSGAELCSHFTSFHFTGVALEVCTEGAAFKLCGDEEPRIYNTVFMRDHHQWIYYEHFKLSALILKRKNVL